MALDYNITIAIERLLFHGLYSNITCAFRESLYCLIRYNISLDDLICQSSETRSTDDAWRGTLTLNMLPVASANM